MWFIFITSWIDATLIYLKKFRQSNKYWSICKQAAIDEFHVSRVGQNPVEMFST